jgi:hypothetical protein
MECQDVFKGFHERIGSRFIDSSEPFLKLQKHALCIFITVLFQSDLEPPVSFLPGQ